LVGGQFIAKAIEAEIL